MDHLNINNNYMVKSDNQLVFIVDGHVKQSRPIYSVPPILIPRYTIDPDVCPYVCLEDYLERTKIYVKTELCSLQRQSSPSGGDSNFRSMDKNSLRRCRY